GELIKATPAASAALDAWSTRTHAVDAFVIVADELQRTSALSIVQELRNNGLRVDYSYTAQKIGKQFTAADNAKARFSIVVGAEFPILTLQNMRTRDKMECPRHQLLEKLQGLFHAPTYDALLV
ncbi:MAG: His/Gly/Thr/Pro-type tRNA ligase C-terminal domain-containing protein, partial [Roseimicrobium sp.]